MKTIPNLLTWLSFLFGILLFLGVATAKAEEYQRFDAQHYNGLFYPDIDMIAWGEPLHLEFQIYDKKNKIDIAGKTIDKSGQPIFLVAVDFTYRGERRCRRIVAPPSFKEGGKLYYYYDNKDHEMNNIIVSAQPMKGLKSYKPKTFDKCLEVAAHTKKPKTEVAETGNKKTPREPASLPGPATIFNENSKDNLKHKDSPYGYQPVSNEFDLYTDRKGPNSPGDK